MVIVGCGSRKSGTLLALPSDILPVGTDPGLKPSKNELTTLFEFTTKETHLLFKGTFYGLVHGVTMGTTLVLILANLFMGNHEAIRGFRGIRERLRLTFAANCTT